MDCGHVVELLQCVRRSMLLGSTPSGLLVVVVVVLLSPHSGSTMRLHQSTDLHRSVLIQEHWAAYLQVLENRLFSEGLHVLGRAPPPEQLAQYLSAYFGEDRPEAAVRAVAEASVADLDGVRRQLERSFQRGAVEGDGAKLEEKVEHPCCVW